MPVSVWGKSVFDFARFYPLKHKHILFRCIFIFIFFVKLIWCFSAGLVRLGAGKVREMNMDGVVQK